MLFSHRARTHALLWRRAASGSPASYRTTSRYRTPPADYLTYSFTVSPREQACAMEARFLKEKLESLLQAEVFLDSDDLFDLTALLDDVRNSEV